MGQRSPDEIRSSIERLRGEVTRATDWRAHVERHSSEIAMGAAAIGLLVGVRLLRRRRRRR